MQDTPLKLGFHAVAEWEKHSALWLAWPYDEITFPDQVEKVEKIYIEIIKSIYESDPVKLLVLNEDMKKKAVRLLKEASVDVDKITFIVTDYADVWTRDYGPMFLKNTKTKERAILKWEYNAYGKFPELLKDNKVVLNLKKAGAFGNEKIFMPRIIMEGGSLEVNGEGIVITTEQCLLHSDRNPDIGKEKIEDILKNYLGVKKIIWLKNGIVNDHTDGHIDDIAKFVSTDTVLCGYEEDPNDPNFEILKSAYEILEKSTDKNENPIKIIKLPMPHMNYDNGEKAPASYANFYIGNRVVLVPTFGDENDDLAIRIIQSVFPDREVTGIDCRDILYGGGAIHCLTRDEPV